MDARTAPDLAPRKLVAFAAFAASLVCVEWAITRTAVFHRGRAVPIAVLFDLVLGLPLIFALAILRPAKRSPLLAAPVVAIGAFVANVLLAGRPEVKALLVVVGPISELAVLSLLVRRVRNGATELRGAQKGDLLLRVATLTDPVLRIAGAEFLVLYYALVAPFVRRAPREDEFAYTKDSGLGGLLFGLGFLMAMEGVTVHLFLQASSPLAAWVHAASDVYALLWLVAAYHAARLRPIALSGDRLLVRVSILWTADVPRDAIASIESISDAPRDRRVLRAALGAPPVLLVTLSRPVEALGPLGIRRTVDRIALYVDEPAKLRAALAP